MGAAACGWSAPAPAVKSHSPSPPESLLGGGPTLFLLWLVRPALVGGGDWKLLLAQGAALGLVAPVAAGLVLLFAAPVAGVQRLTRRGLPSVALGPGLAAGFVTSAVVGVRRFPIS